MSPRQSRQVIEFIELIVEWSFISPDSDVDESNPLNRKDGYDGFAVFCDPVNFSERTPEVSLENF